MQSHEDFLKEALAMASEHSGDPDRGPFAALVVLDGRIIGRGRNQVIPWSDPTAHAEIVAIREAATGGRYHMESAILYSSCEPCPMCLSAIYWARIDTVIYAASAEDADEVGFLDGGIATELSRPWSQRSVKSQRLLAEQGRAVLQNWYHRPDHRLY